MPTFGRLRGVVLGDVGGPFERPLVKACTVCREVKSVDAFHYRGGFGDGRRPKCRECTAVYDAVRSADPVRVSRRNFLRRSRDYGFCVEADEFGLAELVEKHGLGCKGCGVEGVDFIVHHRMPVSLGGPHTLENTVRLCGLCNASVTALERSWVRKAEWSDVE